MGQQRTRISTNDESYDESNQYTSPSRPQAQSTIQINTNEVKNRFTVDDHVDFLHRKLALVEFRINHYYPHLVIKFSMNFSWVC